MHSVPTKNQKSFCSVPFIEKGVEGLSYYISGNDIQKRSMRGGEPCFFSFKCHKPDLSGIAVRLSFESVYKSEKISFKLSVFEAHNPLVLREAILTLSAESNDLMDPFIFDPIPDSRDKTYNLVLDIPAAVKVAKISCTGKSRTHIDLDTTPSQAIPVVLPYFPCGIPAGDPEGPTVEPLVSILIVTYNSEFYIRRCLESVLKLDYPNIEVVVVDNKSSDNTVDIIRSSYKEVDLFTMERNLGYCKANNIGVTHCRGEFIHVLNPDTIVVPDLINQLMMYMQVSPYIAIVGGLISTRGSIVRYADAFLLNHIVASGARFLESGIRFAAAPCGASFLFRKNVLDDVGTLFDEGFEANWEDHDLGLRCWLSGYICLHVPTLGTYHDGGGAFGFVNLKRQTQVYRNHLLTLFKCLGWRVFLKAFYQIIKRSNNRYKLRGVFHFFIYLWKYIPERKKWQQRRRIDDALLQFVASGTVAAFRDQKNR